jgi:dTDP-4-dehydrorhamnose 3,5-epimerase
VTVIEGEIFDVAVDVRTGSPTFGHWAAFTLSGSNGRQLYVPAGFAHGYQTVSDASVVMYKCSDFYSPDDERAVRWDDDDLGIRWPIQEALVSPRDAAAPRLRELPADWLPSIDL